VDDNVFKVITGRCNAACVIPLGQYKAYSTFMTYLSLRIQGYIRWNHKVCWTHT